MSGALSISDFPAFFEAVHGYSPFPWQRRLAKWVADNGTWPSGLDLPTGAGKTAAIDVAIFHLALEADKGAERRAAVRIAFVIDRRLVVDNAYERARKIAEALAEAEPGTVLGHVAERLKRLAGKDGPPLLVHRLRGGIPREDDWTRTPAQPTVLCSTVDQVGSRLLFRGYGVSDSMKPVHAGLIGADCLILLDEAHLAEPFRQTLEWVGRYHGAAWHDARFARPAPWMFAQLSATPGEKVEPPVKLEADDRADPILAARIEASKAVRLIGPSKAAKAGADAEEDAGGAAQAADEEEAATRRRITALVEEALKAYERLLANGVADPALAVVVNRVARARQVFEGLKKEFASKIENSEIDEPILLIGPTRPVERDRIAAEALGPIRTRTWKKGEVRALPKPLLLVATQTIEAGVDIDLDGLVSEVAPLDALRQRFGRLNRAGRDIEAYGAVVAAKSDIGLRHDDAVYGRSLKATWDFLKEIAAPAEAKGEVPTVDFGIDAFDAMLGAHEAPKGVFSDKLDAPVLMPAHVDLLAQTAPVPATLRDVTPFLHGPQRQAPSVTLLWRADMEDPKRDPEATTEASLRMRRLLTLVPPRTREAIELPVWTVKRWLLDTGPLDDLADVAERIDEDVETRPARPSGRVFRWRGDREESEWIDARAIAPGDTIIVPAGYGGVDQYGWTGSHKPATDVADKAADPYAGRRFAVRVAPGLLGCDITREDGERAEAFVARKRKTEEERADALANALAGAPSRRWRTLRDAIAGLDLPKGLVERLTELDNARIGRNSRTPEPWVEAYLDLHGLDDDERPRGIVFVAPLGLKKVPMDEAESAPAATEDDVAGSMPGYNLRLDIHCKDVAKKAADFARRAGVGEPLATAFELAGKLHDLGKADPRFQGLLAHDDPLGADPAHLLAKSARPAPRGHGEKLGLPPRWRHEALSVRLALHHAAFQGISGATDLSQDAPDPDLVLWLIGTHHGHGRPLFPHADRLDREQWLDVQKALGLPPARGVPDGPQSLAFDWNGLDWSGLYERLKARYGVWELARMEAILRLADHRASEEAEGKAVKTGNGKQQEEEAA